VPFGSDRRRLWVGNRREWQIPRAARGNVVLKGDGASFGDLKAVCGNTECGMVVEAAPPAPLIITKAEFLLQRLIIALDPPSPLCEIDQTFEGDILGQTKVISSGKVGNQYLVGSASPCGHSISSHSAARGSVSLVSRCAGRTRANTKALWLTISDRRFNLVLPQQPCRC
jgi:hypothetical protein